MRLILINVVMGIASILIMGFSYWTYNQSVFDNKVKDYFQQKPVTGLSKLKSMAALSDRLVLVKGKIVSDETFMSKNGKKVVLERFLEETNHKNSKQNWKEIKETRFFKVLPFWLTENSDKVLIDGFGLDKTFLGTPEVKTEELSDSLKRTKQWKLVPGEIIYVLGNIENKAGQLVINSPNLYKPNFNPFSPKEPFIITSMSLFEVKNKAVEIAQSLYYTALALFAIAVFFLLTSIMNILKAYKK